MNSTISRPIEYVLPASYSAVVEQLPALPELNIWAKLEQERVTRSYILHENTASSSVSMSRFDVNSMSDDEALSIIAALREHVKKNTIDVSPEIQSFVDENFAELLWR